MMKVLVALALIAMSSVAGAVPVVLVSHQATGGSNTIITTTITDGSHVSGIAGPSTVTWDWDGTTLTGTGLFSATSSVGSSPVAPAILSDQILDLTIQTFGAAGSATATDYSCIEGTFLAGVGVNGCGGYNLGANFVDESTTTWSGTSVSQTLGGDDFPTGGPRTISNFNFGIDSIIGVDGLTPGDLIVLGNGVPLDQFFANRMTFQVVPVPAAAWLFGSALGLLGWARRTG